MLPARRHPGITQIEHIVVIAIIAVLIGLLLPAVQKVREAAARASCENNLHQICLALHDYASVNETFPSAYIGSGYGSRWGWQSLIPPFMEQDNLYRPLGVNTTPSARRPFL